MQVQMRGLQWN